MSENGSNQNLWNSLEVTRILVRLLTPILLFVLTIIINNNQEESRDNEEKIIKQNEQIIENNKRIYDKRLEIYESIAKPMNEIFSYIYYVGKWKELKPVDIVKNKRICDEIMYSYQPLFNPSFFNTYTKFMNSAFETYNGMGEDAKIKSDLFTHKLHSKYSKEWNSKWDDLFIKYDRSMFNTGEKDSDWRREMRTNYNDFLTALSTELVLKENKINNKFRDFKPE